jgi:gliding motility-associated-like protein
MTEYIWQPGNVIVPTITVYTSGTYVLMTLDSLGCKAYDSLDVTVTPAYYTPSLQVTSGPYFCIGDSITIFVNSDLLSLVQWQAPLSGNNFQKVVDSTGTYTCKITYCNIQTTDSITVTELNPKAHITPSDSIPFCFGDSVLLTGNSNLTSYFWLPDSIASNQIYVDTDGVYRLRVADFFGCTALDSIVVTTIPNPHPSISDTTICEGTAATLIASGNHSIEWYDSQFSTVPFDTGYSITTPILMAPVTYYLLSNTSTCRSTRVPVVIDVHICDFYAPNVFTPNGDGYNDYFNVIAAGYNNFHIIIYDRWGLKIFESSNAAIQWNGRVNNTGGECPDGTYYYIISARDVNDASFANHGYLTLIR